MQMVSVTKYFDDVFSYRMTSKKVKFGSSKMSTMSFSQVTNNNFAMQDTYCRTIDRVSDSKRIHGPARI